MHLTHLTILSISLAQIETQNPNLQKSNFVVSELIFIKMLLDHLCDLLYMKQLSEGETSHWIQWCMLKGSRVKGIPMPETIQKEICVVDV